MKIFDAGSGEPIVVIPGLQGRWEWTRPGLVALSNYGRVISYSLPGDIGSGERMDPSRGFDQFVTQLDRVRQRAGVEQMSLCGVSFGGVVALRYAALHPARISRLILASAPGPGWRPTSIQAKQVRHPWRSLPAVALSGVTRMHREVRAALPDRGARIRFWLKFAVTGTRFPALLHLMARRARLLQAVDIGGQCSLITAPTLVITGEPGLDRVVPVESTREYLNQIRGARYVMMDRTGHIGSVTQPERFARIASEFINASNS